MITSIYLTLRLVNEHFPIYVTTMFSFLTLINLPLFVMIYMVYTDLPALLVVSLLLTEYNALLKHDKKGWYLVLLIVTSIIGIQIKTNTFIVTIAIIIHYFLTHKSIKNWIKLIICLFLPIIIGTKLITNVLTINSPISKENIGVPKIHYLLMSLNSKNGKFDQKALKHTYEIKLHHTTAETNKIETKEYLNEIKNNPMILFKSWINKIGNTYSNGVYDFGAWVKDWGIIHSQDNRNILSALAYGKLHRIYIYGYSLLQLVVFLFITISLFIKIKYQQQANFSSFLEISYFGNMFLLLFWENSGRYLIAFALILTYLVCDSLYTYISFSKNK